VLLAIQLMFAREEFAAALNRLIASLDRIAGTSIEGGTSHAGTPVFSVAAPLLSVGLQASPEQAGIVSLHPLCSRNI